MSRTRCAAPTFLGSTWGVVPTWGVALGLTSLGFAQAPRASVAVPAAKPAASSAPAPSVRSTMSEAAARVAVDIGKSIEAPAVFVAPLRSDETLVRGPELSSRIGAIVTGALGAGATLRAEPMTLAAAEASNRTAKWLVYLQAEIARGQLQIVADTYRATHNVWERARQPTPVPVAHTFVAGRIDGEVRSYLAPLPLVLGRVERIGIEDRDVTAVACADVGRGGLEIVTLGRRRIAVGNARAGRFVVRQSAALRDLSGIAPAPLREPLGGVVVVPAGLGHATYIDAGITDRARGSRLDGDLRLVGPIGGVPFATASGDLCASFQGATLFATVAKCSDADPPFDAARIEGPLDAAFECTYVTPDGTARAVSATRDPRTAEIRLQAEGKSATLPHAGAQLAVADLDQDGAPEIVSTLDVPPPPAKPDADAVVITTWQPDGVLRERARTPVPNGARAIAACPPDGSGAAAVVVATQGELWIVR